MRTVEGRLSIRRALRRGSPGVGGDSGDRSRDERGCDSRRGGPVPEAPWERKCLRGRWPGRVLGRGDEPAGNGVWWSSSEKRGRQRSVRGPEWLWVAVRAGGGRATCRRSAGRSAGGGKTRRGSARSGGNRPGWRTSGFRGT